jgi:CheY-like chemotaxis protein
MKQKVLVVDDDSNIRFVLCGLLEDLGLEVKEAQNGREALEIWGQWKPALILMDWSMPVMDGKAAIENIRSLEKENKTVIVALSARTNETDRKEIMSSGADRFLGKPYREKEMVNLLGDYLEFSAW